VKTISRLRRTLLNFERHLKPGGVLIFEPWFTKKTWKVGVPRVTTYSDKNIAIARSAVSKINRSCSVLEFHYLVALRGGTVKHFSDRHEMGLFDHGTTLSILRQIGLKAYFRRKWLTRDRGLFVATKSI
jgi:hypothetical protein